jgi:quinol monooxygenase YgiN
MATFIAHIRIKPGHEQAFEEMARAMYAATHGTETHVLRYEYWRAQAERTYYVLEAFDDYRGFLEHQSSEHHETLTAGFRDMIEDFRIEWIDPVQGASPLPATTHQEPGSAASDLARAYAERMPAEAAPWWAPLR